MTGMTKADLMSDCISLQAEKCKEENPEIDPDGVTQPTK
jgi:hypothetical protein